MSEELKKILEATQHIKKVIPTCNESPPLVGIVCGSGLGQLTDILDNPQCLHYSMIPHFVPSTVFGHIGKYVFGSKDGVQLICMKGRVHLYEGYSPIECVRPIRVMAMLGIKFLIVTNAAGQIQDTFNVGDLMIIKDQISFPSFGGDNPLRGDHHPAFGERFVPMTKAYDSKLIEMAVEVGKELDISDKLRQGVYMMLAGPTFETYAEAKLLKLLGCDAVGMSTANEVTVATQMGIKCLGISLMTNKVSVGPNDIDCDHLEVLEVAKGSSEMFIKLIVGLLHQIGFAVTSGQLSVDDNRLYGALLRNEINFKSVE